MATSWLSDWAYRKKITIDNTNIDSDLTHFPIPIVLNDQQLDIFTELGTDSKKIALTEDDGLTQLYGEIECWESSSAGSKGTADATYDFGSSGGGLEGFTAYGSPVDNGTYYTFNGTNNGLYKTTDLGDSSDEVIFMTFRCHDKNKGSIQILWKDGGGYNGIAMGIDADGNLGIFGASLGVVTSLIIKSENYENDVWYDIYFTKTRITLIDHTTSVNVFSQAGTVTAGDGTSPESVGVCYESSPISGITYSSWGEFFDGDIDTIEVYPGAELTAPVPYNAVIWASKSSWTVYSAATTDIYIYFDSTKADNTTYIGDIGDSQAQNVWDSNFELVCHFAQDPSGGANSIKDSTSNIHHLTPAGSMTSGDLIEGYIGKAISLDGTDDFLYTTSASDGLDITTEFTLEAVLRPFFTDVSIGDVGPILSRQGYPNANVDSYALVVNSDEELQLGTYGGNIQGQTLSLASIFQYWVGTYESTGLTGDLFIDGVKETLSTDNYDTMAGGVNSLAIGRNNPGQYAFVDFSEVRVSLIQRSDAWIKATQYCLIDDILIIGATEEYTVGAVSLLMTPDSGEYLKTQLITLTASVSGASIYYTTDGSDPTTGDTLYSGPFELGGAKTIKAFAVKSGYDDSTIVTKIYTITPTTIPIFKPDSGVYSSVDKISIYHDNSAEIYYSKYNQDNFILYTAPIDFFEGTLYAYAVRTAYDPSEITSATYEKSFTTDWKEQKNLGPWEFSKTKANNLYNIGEKIVSSTDPVWSMDKFSGVKITNGHIPCGYWNNIITPTVEIGSMNILSGPNSYDIVYLPDYGGVSGRFVCCNIRGQIWYTDTNGSTWTQVSNTGLQNDDCTDIVYIDKKVIVTATQRIWVSYNGGVTWTKGPQQNPPYSTFIGPVTWNSNVNKYVVLGEDFPGVNTSYLYTSDDALNWTQTYTFGQFASIPGNAFYKNQQYAFSEDVGTLKLYLRSSDLLSWNNVSLVNLPAERKNIITDGSQIVYSRNISSDGVIWQDFPYTFSYGDYYEPYKLWLLGAISETTHMYYSFNGKDWNQLDFTFPYTNNRGIAIGKNYWLRVSSSGIGAFYRGKITNL